MAVVGDEAVILESLVDRDRAISIEVRQVVSGSLRHRQRFPTIGMGITSGPVRPVVTRVGKSCAELTTV